MTHPPPPGPIGDDATRTFPAGGAPPPPPPDPAGYGAHPGGPGGPVPGYGTAGPDPTAVGPVPGYGHHPGGPGGPVPGYGLQPAGPSGPGPMGPAAPSGRRRGRILGRALVVLLVIAALAGTTAWGFVNRSSAEEWRDRSEGADADLREALDRLEATSSDLDDARTRLRELANENAGETDRNRILSDIVAQAPDVTAALAQCQQMTAELANDIIALLGDPEPDVSGLQARTDEINEVCAAALDQAEALADTIEGLGI